MDKYEKLGSVIGFFIGVALVCWGLQALWNAILPKLILGITDITYWQAVGVYLITGVLFRNHLGATLFKSKKDK